MFVSRSKSESITPAKFQLDRVKIVRALIPIWPLPEAIPQKLQKKFFVRSKKILFPVLSGGKDSTPAKFQLDRFITVGGVDGQTNTHTYPYVNYSKIEMVDIIESIHIFKSLDLVPTLASVFQLLKV